MVLLILRRLFDYNPSIRTRGSGSFHVPPSPEHRGGLFCSRQCAAAAGSGVPPAAPDHFLIELLKRTWETTAKPLSILSKQCFSLSWRSSSRKKPKSEGGLSTTTNGLDQIKSLGDSAFCGPKMRNLKKYKGAV